MISKEHFIQRKEPLEIGKKYGRLTILGKDHKGPHGWLYKCLCDCGTECSVLAHRIGKSTMSCGCYKNECRGSHKESATRLYKIWVQIKRRCLNKNLPSYPMYGGRGITICEEWMRYETFRDWSLANGYSDSLSIDRIDVDGNYEPSNCRWATKSQQVINRRPFGVIPYDGITPDKTGYRAQLMLNGKKVYVGHSTTIKGAVEIRNAYIIDHRLPHKINVYKD